MSSHRASAFPDPPNRWFTSDVRVRAHDLMRLLLGFRHQLESVRRLSHGASCPPGCTGDAHPATWEHGADWDMSFEALADVIDAYLAALGQPPDPRLRCAIQDRASTRSDGMSP